MSGTQVSGRARRDAVIAAAVVLTGGVLFTRMDTAEALSAALSHGEAFELDDVLLTLVLAVLSVAWFAIRRYRDARQKTEALRVSEAARQRSIERLGELSARLMSAEAHERERIAAVLHDAVSQPLYAARLRLDAFLERPEGTRAPALVGEARELIEAAMAQGRDLTVELSPGLNDLPIVDALEALAGQLADRYRVPVRVERAGPWAEIAGPCKAPIYEAVRELVSNAGKHGEASEVVVSARPGAAGALAVHVCDDGRGFDPEARETRGFGLLSIEQRLRRADVALSVQSGPGRGTTAVLQIPPS